MSLCLTTLLQTFVFRFFSICYPISLNFLYKDKQFFNFYLTIIIIFLAIIYFIFFYLYIINRNDKKKCLKCFYRTKQYSNFLIGYLVQLNLAFLDTYEIKDGKLKINKTLFILKILMTLETMKRIYYYGKGIKLLISVECEVEDKESEGYYMIFEVINSYFWYNVFSNFFAGGYSQPKSELIFGLIVAILHGILAMGCYFIVVKIFFGVLNLIYLSGHIYTIYWSIKQMNKYNY